MLLKLYQAGQPILRARAKLLTPAALASRHVQEVIDFMVATLRDAPGVGLAAPQVGEKLRIIIIEDKSKYHEPVPPEVLQAQLRRPVPLKVLVNPTIQTVGAKRTLFFEGCLSVEGYVAAVPRAASVKVEAWDRQGNPVAYTARGWHARILQHELDHLEGTLYVDRMRARSFMSVKNFNSLWRKALQPAIEKKFPRLGGL